MKIRPLFDKIVIEPIEAEERTKSGIILPTAAQEKQQMAKVIAVGPGTKDETMQVSVGDSVLYGKYAGTEIEVDGEKLLIMRQSDILAKF